MIFSEYVSECKKTESDPRSDGVKSRLTANARYIHAVMGIVTEASELLDIIKKHVFYGKNTDVIDLIDEMGDLYYYTAILVDYVSGLTGLSPDELDEMIMDSNIKKLRQRYADGFSSSEAINRDKETEKKVVKDNVR